MSVMRHLAVGVETTLLDKHFEVVTVTVGVMRVPAYSNKLLAMVRHV